MVPGPAARPQRVPHDVLPAARGHDLRTVGQAADDGHAGEAGGWGGGEGAAGEAGWEDSGRGGEGGAEGGAEGGEEGHFFFWGGGGGVWYGWMGSRWVRDGMVRWMEFDVVEDLGIRDRLNEASREAGVGQSASSFRLPR